MSNPQIWHNPRCSKSRQTLQLLEEHGIKAEVFLYKETAPSIADIREVLAELGKDPHHLIRQKDAAFKALDLPENADDNALIKAMAAHPEIIERPIVRHNGKAALGRPPENVLTLFE